MANAFVTLARRVYNPMGFTKGIKFALFVVLMGLFAVFACLRLNYLNYWVAFCGENRPRGTGAMPGDCYYFTKPDRYQLGMRIHLATVLPATILACFQFVPVLRRQCLLFHRVNGYVVFILAILGTVGALMMVRRSAGGGIDTQTGNGFLAALFVYSLTMAIINIRRVQIDQHRAWMIRAWAYAGAIISTRILLFTCVMVISRIGGYWFAQPCNKIYGTFKSEAKTLQFYPQCAAYFNGQVPDQHVAVRATFYGNIMEIASAFNISFGPAVWMSVLLHFIGAELYLRLTQGEQERLRNISYRRQQERGMKNPGNAGFTFDRFGDAPKWAPQKVVATDAEREA